MRLFKLALTIALAMFIIDGVAAMADTHVFEEDVDDGSGNYLWQTAANWDLGSVPSAGDEAEIRNGLTAVVRGTSDICGFVDIQGNGEVVVEASAKLTLDGNGTARTSAIASDARLYLEGSGAELAVIDDDHTLSGAGKVVGQDDAAKITVTTGETLTNSLTAVDPSTAGITGHLEISGAGNFTNNGIVNADTGGESAARLKIAVTGTLEDTTGDHWMATAANSILSFDSALVTISADGMLSGNFVISGSSSAEIENHEQCLRTEGRLEMSDGLLDVQECLTMGDNTNYFMSISGASGNPQIVVAYGKTFNHY